MTTAPPRRFDPAAPEHAADPHPMLRLMREQAPVYRHADPATGRVFWYLTRDADVRHALAEPALGRQLDRLPRELAARHRAWDRDPLPMVRRNVFNLDPPDHTRLRRLLAPTFGARAVAALAPRIRRAAGDLVERMPGQGEIDLIRSLALPLPILIMAELLAIPPADLPRLRRWSDGILRSRDMSLARHHGMEYIAYLQRTLTERRAAPGDDLMSRLAAAERDGEISRAELLSSVFQLLLAGDETTANLIGNGLLELLRHPGEAAKLRARPELIDPAVEEMLRFNGPVGHSRPLYALADVDIGGTTIPCGDTVMPMLLAANRDPAAFERPDVFDVARAPNRHLGFGHGIHFCPGAALARLQVRAAVGALVRRFPGMTLAAGPSGLDWTPDLFVRGVRRLPVRPHR
ncbi:cytochrome P450 family protein [Nonomuraea candida]|uniref:cytochrome P450 family protein n=1 Tax=Nonomuraea candida TaxID=359159 RepID=UPI0005BAF6E6|nr:cytochrome P450 [Nonomuraea candida]